MSTKVISWQTLYLHWAGLFSACVGLLSITAFIFGWFQGVAGKGLWLAIAGFAGTIGATAIARDILDRVRNHEMGADSISVSQQRFAWIATRTGFAYWLSF